MLFTLKVTTNCPTILLYKILFWKILSSLVYDFYFLFLNILASKNKTCIICEKIITYLPFRSSADVILTGRDPVFGSFPFSVQHGGCETRGRHVILPVDNLLQSDSDSLNIMGMWKVSFFRKKIIFKQSGRLGLIPKMKTQGRKVS